ncbi:MAG: NmrA family NAD(P)-binding protein [Xanthobacteraceae bacterium]
MIAVIGATGNTGRATVKELGALGENPLCVVRNADKAREVLGADAKTAIAEVHDRAALEKALKGVKRVFIVTGHNPQSGEQQINILEAAKAAGAEYVVKVSGGRAMATPDSETPVGRGHHAVEEAMKKSGLGWVILRPGLYMQNTLGQATLIKNESKMALPFAADLPLAFIDTRDAGAVGAHVVRDAKKYAGQTIEYSGRQSTYGDFAKVFSEVLGKNVTYIAAPYDVAEKAMKARGLPDWLIGHQLTIARLAAKGGFSAENTKPIKEILGRDPITTKQFVQDHKAAFS